MITTFEEYQYGVSIILTPETPEEMAFLLRMTVNSKRVVPDIRTRFADNQKPHCDIWLQLKAGKRTSISNEKSVLP